MYFLQVRNPAEACPVLILALLMGPAAILTLEEEQAVLLVLVT